MTRKENRLPHGPIPSISIETHRLLQAKPEDHMLSQEEREAIDRDLQRMWSELTAMRRRIDEEHGPRAKLAFT